MTLENNVSFVLRCGAIIGIVIVVIGLAADLIGIEYSKDIMTTGIATIVFTPFAGMIVSLVTLSMGREKKYAVSALALIVISAAGMLVAYWLA